MRATNLECIALAFEQLVTLLGRNDLLLVDLEVHSAGNNLIRHD